MKQYFGLFSTEEQDATPLISLETDVQIQNSIAKVTLAQVYENNRDKAIETEYFFPVNDLGIFHSFEAVY